MQDETINFRSRPGVRSRRGVALLYVVVAMMTLLLLTTLAVDYGRVQVAKNELRYATDAAARYAATGLSDSSYFTKASVSASDNTVDGTALSLQSGDVVTGNWAGGVFTSGGTPKNAVEINAQRSVSRGNAIPILLGFTAASCNITATSIATYTAAAAQYGIVGLNSVQLQNNTILTDSYDSSAGPYSASTALDNGGVASNGNINLNGTVTVKSNLYMQSSSSISQNGTINYGTRETLSAPLSYAVASAGSSATTNNNSALSPYLSSGNFNMSSGVLNVPAGTYYMNSFSMNGGTLNIQGAATFYINGNFTVQGGGVTVANNLPANFSVNVIASAGANFTNLSNLYINLYCPTSPINVNSCSNIYGSFIGSSLSVSGSCGLHVDQSLLSGSGSGAGTVDTVK
jgi:Flp pilus assembly protein TadG